MTATQIIQLLNLVSALTPVLVDVGNGIKDLTGKDLDIEKMSIADLTALKEELLATAPENWPKYQFQSPVKG